MSQSWKTGCHPCVFSPPCKHICDPLSFHTRLSVWVETLNWLQIYMKMTEEMNNWVYISRTMATTLFFFTVRFQPLSSASRTSCNILKVLDWRGAVRDSLFSWIILYTSESLSNLCMAKSELELLQEGKKKTFIKVRSGTEVFSRKWTVTTDSWICFN